MYYRLPTQTNKNVKNGTNAYKNELRNLMHAVDWLPTLMTAVGHPGLATTATDGVDQWQALTAR
jgi:arylsulfatase A-like enzyme